MTRHYNRAAGCSKQVQAWGIKRREVDINQLALAYYLLARRRIEQHKTAQIRDLPPGDDREAV